MPYRQYVKVSSSAGAVHGRWSTVTPLVGIAFVCRYPLPTRHPRTSFSSRWRLVIGAGLTSPPPGPAGVGDGVPSNACSRAHRSGVSRQFARSAKEMRRPFRRRVLLPAGSRLFETPQRLRHTNRSDAFTASADREIRDRSPGPNSRPPSFFQIRESIHCFTAAA